MGTLTANCPRLDSYCSHKLPSSCRLTATPVCCACADRRPHAASYSVYIDGVGFVMRGTRWQRYCWFCKEFWQNRVRASNLRPAETRIPEQPDQTEFLNKWYEFHQGYRVVKHEDGSEDRIAVLGEPFRDVSPGYLPRRVDELRSGRNPPQNPYIQLADSTGREPDTAAQTGGQINLEDALDQMLEQAEADEAQQGSEQQQEPEQNAITVEIPPINPQPVVNPHYQTRRVAALRRELNRMRTGVERVISGLRELGEDVDSWRTDGLADLGRTLDDISTVATQELQTSSNPRQERSTPSRSPAATSENLQNNHPRMHGPLANLQHRLDQANSRLERARRARERAADELEAAESEVQAGRELVRMIEREQRTAENYVRIFGTREEMETAGAEYESPIGGMFNRAWNRYRVAEEVRREERNLREALEGEERVVGVEGPSQAQMTELGASGNELNRNTLDEGVLREYYATLRMQDGTQGALSDLETTLEAAQQSLAHSTQLREHLAQAHQQQDITPPNSSFSRLAARRAWLHRSQHELVVENDSSDSDQDSPRGLDQPDDGRPAPKSDEDMTVKLECKICYQQLADTVVLPCGHLVMCEWCAMQHIPSHHGDHTRPKRPTDCPLCRKRVKQKVKVFQS